MRLNIKSMKDYSVIGKVEYLQNPIIQIPFLSYSELIQKMDRYTKLGAEKLLAKNSMSLRSILPFVHAGHSSKPIS